MEKGLKRIRKRVLKKFEKGSKKNSKKGLKRIMTVGGVYGTRNYTVKDLRDQKGKKTLTETVPFSVEEAAAAEEAGIDTMKVTSREDEVKLLKIN